MKSRFWLVGGFLIAFHPGCVWLKPNFDRSERHWSFVWLGFEVARCDPEWLA